MRLFKSGKLKILLLTVIFISVIFIFPAELVAETYKFWVDTSHWDTKPVEYIESGYSQVTARQKWIDTSYTVNQGYWKDAQQRRWADTSYTILQGYWEYYW